MSSPSRPTYDAATIAQIRSWVQHCESWREARAVIADKLGIHRDNVTRMNRRHGLWRPEAGTQGARPEGASKGPGAAGGEFSVDVETNVPKTLDEVVKLCAVDLDQWEAKSFGLVRKKSSYGWSARFMRKPKSPDIAPVIAAFERAVASRAPKKWVYEKGGHKDRDCLYVINCHDLHIAKLAAPQETGGAAWDTKISDQVFRATVDELMDKAPKDRIEEVLIIIGSDMLQVDNNQSSTTAGTYVDSDSRLSKIFEVAAKAVTDIIEKLASRFKVRAVVIPGNHDTAVSLFLGKYVEAWFRSHPNVVVDSSPKSRKYYGYDNTLIGFDHGNNTKLADLPLIMMRENQEVISRYRHLEMLTGDKHHEQVNDYKGVRVRIAPALCPPDKWHSDKGYVGSIRQSQGLLYRRKDGLEAIFYSAPLD